MDDGLVFGVSDFVAYVNQTLEFAYPFVAVRGEITEFKVSKNRWVFFTLKDEVALLRCFATVYALPGPLEDGMLVQISGAPKLHERYGFSFTAQSISLVGEGALKRGAELLQAKLAAEGLFDESRKRALPEVPRHIAMVTAADSAASADFIKIAKARWGGLRVDVYDTFVQGEQAPAKLVAAIKAVNAEADLPEVLVLVRGGGSAEDLAAFNHEEVVRAVASSRVPMLVAIGHEIDVSLAELAADLRASTPSNAAELLLPDKQHELVRLRHVERSLDDVLKAFISSRRISLEQYKIVLDQSLQTSLETAKTAVKNLSQLLYAFSPMLPLERGYALVKDNAGRQISSIKGIAMGDVLQIQVKDGIMDSEVKNIQKGKL